MGRALPRSGRERHRHLEDGIALTDDLLRLGAYALCLDDAGRLLMSRVSQGLPDAGQWTIPGGGVYWGESPDDAVIRELHEETGLGARAVYGVVGIYSNVYTSKAPRMHHVGIVYRVTAADGDLVFEQEGSTDRCEWFARAQVLDLPLTTLGEFAVRLAWPDT